MLLCAIKFNFHQTKKTQRYFQRRSVVNIFLSQSGCHQKPLMINVTFAYVLEKPHVSRKSTVVRITWNPHYRKWISFFILRQRWLGYLRNEVWIIIDQFSFDITVHSFSAHFNFFVLFCAYTGLLSHFYLWINGNCNTD